MLRQEEMYTIPVKKRITAGRELLTSRVGLFRSGVSRICSRIGEVDTTLKGVDEERRDQLKICGEAKKKEEVLKM